MSLFAFKNARIFTGLEFIDHQYLLTDGKTIIGIQENAPEGAEVIDCSDSIIAPGLIELQVYGGKGALFTTEPTPETIQKTYEEHLKGGTTHFQITYHTGPLSGMLAAIQACRSYRQQGGAGLVGLHLEGPYFNPVKKGAHLLSYIRKATIAELTALVEAADDLPLYLTLAPEEADPEVLEWLLSSPILLSAGHSNATYTEAIQAFDRGIGLVTHLFNAMSPFNSREPGLLGATLDSSVRASIIADGIHVDFASVRIAKKMMGDRLFLITDAVTEDTRGEYRFTINPERRRFEDENGTLSGSSLTLIEAVKNCVNEVGIPLEEALRMASLYPAQIIGKDHTLGRLGAGYEASFILFDQNFQMKGYHTEGKFTRI
ncbi:N-acetylglucosamine-6-phosphate deacetylase [Siphonobacter sp. SORGH_AS_0500]|uniref:N-acetylglucosamine-6-phosphate deacetylase n=1 Tax=Siphonobacter sp. SORGH_AS_0500 TaxID=1864824 RepID=UPI000CC9D011|nr:N-acetylglucosamine-6-phosphate deacetylase [Siphonobacter sp. SORGH_AS_0500]PKK36667.1 N-acetylglucosamine-6-phosphate deacetylase [Siphonobacter sp. SORGH_AS_0500]